MGVTIQPIPNEVILEILSHLGKNDLLVCRLVSLSWNKLSLKTLRNPKNEYYHELTQDNIQKFIEFWNGRNEEWVLPFHLNFDCTLNGKIRLPLQIEEYEDEDVEAVEDYYGIPKYIQQLHSVFGTKCVSGLTLNHEAVLPVSSVTTLIQILTAIFPSLTYLDLSKFKLWFEEEEDLRKVKKFLQKLAKIGAQIGLRFSKLSRLISCPAPILLHEEDEDDREEKKENELHAFIIEKSQNLKELEVISPLDLSVLQKQMGSLRKLKIVEALQQLDTFALPTLPVLSDLSLTYSTALLEHQILIEFLSSFSTSLQSLTVTFKEIPKNPFPTLSQLKFLGIFVSTSTRARNARMRVDMQKLNLNSEAFPVLEFIDISTNVDFQFTDANSGNSKDDSSLPGVKKLCIRVMDSPFNAYEIDQNLIVDEDQTISTVSANDYVDHLQELFPNVTSLTLVNESGGHEEYLSQLLYAFIQSDGAARIKELELQNCEKNHLGHILNGLEDPENPDKQALVILQNMTMDAGFLKSILKAFEGFSDVSDLNVVNELEFRDGAENRVITSEAPTPTSIFLKMTGLEKIKIHTDICLEKIKIHTGSSRKLNEDSEEIRVERESNQWNQKDLFLMSLAKYFPLLRQIDISQRMFGDDKEFCKQQIVDVHEKFPDLIINTTQ